MNRAQPVRDGSGPCLHTLSEQQTVRLPDMPSEQRRPEFAKRATFSPTGSSATGP
ncbi:MAG: hypothetical protein M3524_09620 [Actinomycetota bacterium]|nr:hypothetical protein [Actinomycetota bacterium]